MAEEIRIDIKANDKASTVLKQVAKNSQNLGTSTKGLAGIFGKLGGGLNEAVTSLTGFNLASIATVATVGKLIDGISDTVAEYSSYVEQVDKVSQRTGMASEEVSRLLQVADDFRVDIKSMENAMSMALQNGFVPTTENLALLADELTAIQDPTAKAAKLQEIFGRQWREIVPLLSRGGDAIREASAGIADGLVVTQEAIDANRQYQQAVDDLSDSWTAYKYTIMQDVMPALAEFLSLQTEAMAAVQDGQGKIEGMAGASSILALEQQQAAQATENWGLRYQGMADAIEGASAATDGLTESSEELIEMQEDLAKAQDAYNKAQQQYNEQLGSQAARLLDDSAESSNRYEEGLSAVDEVMGTHLRTEHEQQQALEELSDLYNSGQIDLAGYKEGLTEIRDTFGPLNDKIEETRNKLAALAAQIRGMGGTLSISVSYSGPSVTAPTTGTTGTSGGRTTFGGESEGATGLDMVVPPGYPNDSYNIKVTSGEHVKVTPAGQTGTVNNYNLIINEAGTRGNILSDFNLLKALTRA